MTVSPPSNAQPDAPLSVARSRSPVRQLTFMIPNVVGSLSQVVQTLHEQQVEVLGLTLQDASESTRVRMVVSDPDTAAMALATVGYHAILHEILVLELSDVAGGFAKILCALLEGEVNLLHSYSLMIHDQLHGFVALMVDDQSIGEDCLSKAGFKLLSQDQLSR